jgi:ferritin-like metal-binding protein YciE
MTLGKIQIAEWATTRGQDNAIAPPLFPCLQRLSGAFSHCSIDFKAHASDATSPLLRKHDASPQDASEQKILKSLPKMIDKATNRDLVAGLKSHLEETNKQVERLQKVFEKLGKQASGTQCPAIDGIIKEADETAGEIGDKAVLDAAIVANAQAVEHDEMCRYGTLIAWAEELGHNEIVRFQSRGRSVRVRAARSERHLQRTYQAATETIRQASDMMNVAGMLSAPPTKKQPRTPASQAIRVGAGCL